MTASGRGSRRFAAGRARRSGGARRDRRSPVVLGVSRARRIPLGDASALSGGARRRRALPGAVRSLSDRRRDSPRRYTRPRALHRSRHGRCNRRDRPSWRERDLEPRGDAWWNQPRAGQATSDAGRQRRRRSRRNRPRCDHGRQRVAHRRGLGRRVRDVPPNSTVVGIPGRVILRDGKPVAPAAKPTTDTPTPQRRRLSPRSTERIERSNAGSRNSSERRMDPMLRLYNTLTRSVEPFEPSEPGHARIYVCGLTPSARSHLGHARSFMFFNVLRRHLVKTVYVSPSCRTSPTSTIAASRPRGKTARPTARSSRVTSASSRRRCGS